jgi:methylated-DNA-protein-cysteine methyltransferase related protein
MEEASRRIIALVCAIPRGRVVSYGQIAAMAGLPNGARQVARLLHSSSGAHRLPWHRVINAAGGISLPPGAGGELQRALLEREGVVFVGGKADFGRHGWRPTLA